MSSFPQEKWGSPPTVSVDVTELLRSSSLCTFPTHQTEVPDVHLSSLTQGSSLPLGVTTSHFKCSITRKWFTNEHTNKIKQNNKKEILYLYYFLFLENMKLEKGNHLAIF